MAIYQVQYEPEAERRLSHLPPEIRVEVQSRLDNLADAPVTERPGRTHLDADIDVDGTLVRVQLDLPKRVLRVLDVVVKQG